VYVVDSGNNRVQEFTNDGKFVNKWGLPPLSGSITGTDIDVSSAGTIYLTSADAGTITVISTSPTTSK
jgi:DNA-binding beta-propeller fold protein YncE